MWSKSHSVVTKKVTKEQIWKLFKDVNNWNTWDKGIEYAKMEGEFVKGNYFQLKPKGGPEMKIQIKEVIENKLFIDFTKFPGAKMYGEHTFEETSEGLRITTTMKMEGILGFLWRKIVANGIVEALPSDMLDQIEAASKL